MDLNKTEFIINVKINILFLKFSSSFSLMEYLLNILVFILTVDVDN